MKYFSVVKIIITLALIIGGTFYITERADKDEMEVYIENYNKFKSQADSANHFADSLKTQIVIQENEARTAVMLSHVLGQQVKTLKSKTSGMKDTRDSLKKTITDSSEMARKIIPVQDSIISHQDTIIHKQSEQIEHLSKALTLKDSTISLLSWSRDSLQTIIRNIPPAPKNPNKMFGITLPSRKVIGIAGFVVGVLTTVVVIK
mgnify:CR=1 FL=1